MQRHVLKVLGLSFFAALSMMALASIAQAGEIKVLGKQVAVGQKFTGEQEGTSKFLVPALNIEIRCTSADYNQGSSIASGTVVETLWEVLDLGCTVWSGGVQVPQCHVLDNSGTEGDITLKYIEIVNLNGTSTVTRRVPDGGTTIGKFKYTSGLGCTLATPVELKGELGFNFVTGNLQTGSEVVEPLIESSEAIQKSLKLEIKYGANPAYLDSSAKLKLAGTNVGCTWGAL